MIVSLDKIAGLGFMGISSCAVSADGRKVYFGRSASRDPAMRNLVVATLDQNGNILGIPKCYPCSSSAFPLAPIDGYHADWANPDPAYDPNNYVYNSSVSAIVLDEAKRRLYMGEVRTATIALTSGLNVYELDANGDPTGSVATYSNGYLNENSSIYAMVLHPTLPLLYFTGQKMAGVGAYSLDPSGDPSPTPPPPPTQPPFYPLGPYGKIALGISDDGRYLYMGTNPDTLEVVELDSNGVPIPGTFKSYPFNSNGDYLSFVMGKNAIYLLRPNTTGMGLPVLGSLPLSSSTGQPIMPKPDLYPDIHPFEAGTYSTNKAMTIAVDKIHNKLWVAIRDTFFEAFATTPTVVVSGVVPTSYSIQSDGSLSTNGVSTAPIPSVGNACVLVPLSNGGRPLFCNYYHPNTGNRVRGYKCRITITAIEGSPCPASVDIFVTGAPTTPVLVQGLNIASSYIELDDLLKDNDLQVWIGVTADTTDATSITVKFDLFNQTFTPLKSVTETAQAKGVFFLLPGYRMAWSCLEGSVTGLQSFTERSADFLAAAHQHLVAPQDRPKEIITDCYQLVAGNGANIEIVDNLAQAMQLLGFNTAAAYEFTGMDLTQINAILNHRGLFNRQYKSLEVNNVTAAFSPTYGFDTNGNMTPEYMAQCVKTTVDYIHQSLNGGLPSQVAFIVADDEPARFFPDQVDTLNTTREYVPEFQNYLQDKGLSLSSLTVTATTWTDLQMVYPNDGNPPGGATASIENRRLYYWTMRFLVDSWADAIAMYQQALKSVLGRPAPVVVCCSNRPNRWFEFTSAYDPPTYAMIQMDWMLAGRLDGYPGWAENTFPDTQANSWSYYAAVMRSSALQGSHGFGGYVKGIYLGALPGGGKYKIMSLIGNGAKIYSAWTFGPTPENGDRWCENCATLLNSPPFRGNAYAEYADANRLIGRSEKILAHATPARSRIAILSSGISGLWDINDPNPPHTNQKPYYYEEMEGLYLALSHGLNTSVDFVDDTDVINGALIARDYHVLYIAAPNVAAAAQAAIVDWVNTFGTHNRQLVLCRGAGTHDEYNSSTTAFDQLAGLTGRTADHNVTPATEDNVYLDTFSPKLPRSPVPVFYDQYSTTVNVQNADYYFNNQSLHIKGPFEPLSLSTDSNRPSIDLVYISDGSAACTTKKYDGGNVANYVTAFGFFPGWQYMMSPVGIYMDQLPQDWSIMAREIAVMPAIRQNPPRSVHILGGRGPGGETLTEANHYLTTQPVEALRLNLGGAPTAVAVVLLNWSGTPLENMRVTIVNGVAQPNTFGLASGGVLTNKTSVSGKNSATLTLKDVDVLLIGK